MSQGTKHLLGAAGLLLAVALSVVRVSTWASRADVRCAVRGSALEVHGRIGGAALDFALRLPAARTCSHGG